MIEATTNKTQGVKHLMNILIIGSGGREHTFAWKIAQNPDVKTVFVAPGNGGTAIEQKTVNLDIDPLDFDALIHFCREQPVDLTIVGPEAPLAAGIVDHFIQAGLPCFGPSQAAAQLESSKSFSKAFMRRYGIATANYESFNDYQKAKTYLQTQSFPLVIKADGLAAGKGVVIAQSLEEAEHSLAQIMQQQSLGDAGHTVVIEEFLTGEEASFIVVTDGEHIVPLASSQDHKARDDGDKGPNTGGMGAYSPAPIINATMQQRIIDEVIQPTIQGMKKEGNPFRGFLYAGLMISDNGDIKVLEFNCRFGDPETQAVLFRLQSDLVELIQAALNSKLTHYECLWDPRAAVTVVMASLGYPGSYARDFSLDCLNTVDDVADVKIFHAGTRWTDQHLQSTGGRVLAISALGDTVKIAQEKCYQLINTIQCEQLFCRHDIAHRAIAREMA